MYIRFATMRFTVENRYLPCQHIERRMSCS